MKPATILLAEDDLEDVELIEFALSKISSFCEIIAVHDGKEAIAYLAREGKYADREKFPDPALILLDITMPTIDGFGVLMWMQRQPEGTMPPVVMLSYSHHEREIRLAYELGAKAYLTKSVGAEGTAAIVGAVDRFLKTRLLPAEVAAGF